MTSGGPADRKPRAQGSVDGGGVLLQILAAATATLAIVSDGMHYGWPSPSTPQMVNNTNCTRIGLCMTRDEGSFMAVMPLVGAVIGALSAALIVDILGRKKTIIATAVPFFVAWIMVAFAKSVAVLYAARFLAGIADGVTFTAVPIYIGEISSPRIRGLLGSGCSVTWIFGFLLINIVGSYLSISHTALVASAIPAVLILTFAWMPESPYYLLMRGRDEEALSSLRTLRRQRHVDDEFERIKTAVRSQNKNTGKFLDLFTIKSNRSAVLIIAGLRGFQQFSGTTAIQFYAHTIFDETRDVLQPHHASILYFTVQFAMTVLSSGIVDKAGRRPLLIVSMAGSALALLAEGGYLYATKKLQVDASSFKFVPVIALIVFVVVFSIGMQSIPVLLLGELFPTNVKAFALCLADVYYSVVATIASLFLQQTNRESLGLHVAFFGFAAASLLGLLFIIFCVPETKGKTLEEIQDYLKGKDASVSLPPQFCQSEKIRRLEESDKLPQ